MKNTITIQANSTDISHIVWLQDLLRFHVDREDRKVKVISGEGWKFQFKDEPELSMEPGVEIEIPKGKFHKVIKGTTDLVVEVEIILEVPPMPEQEPIPEEEPPIPEFLESSEESVNTDSD